MAVRLRLQRLGVANNPHYRIVAATRMAKRDGKYLELLGNYNPTPNPKTGLKTLQVKQERALYWLSVGAEPSDRVAWLFAKAGLLPEPPIPTNKTLAAQPKKKAQQRMAEQVKKKQAAEEAKVAEASKAASGSAAADKADGSVKEEGKA
jgi:small subunit ribosomal protein S16